MALGSWTHIDDGTAVLTCRAFRDETIFKLNKRYPGTLDESTMDRYLSIGPQDPRNLLHDLPTPWISSKILKISPLSTSSRINRSLAASFTSSWCALKSDSRSSWQPATMPTPHKVTLSSSSASSPSSRATPTSVPPSITHPARQMLRSLLRPSQARWEPVFRFF